MLEINVLSRPPELIIELSCTVFKGTTNASFRRLRKLYNKLSYDLY